MDSHLTSEFCECLQPVIRKGDSGLAYEISPMYRESRPARPTGPAFPSTAPVAGDTAPPPAHDTPDVCVRPAPTPRAGTTGSRARHDRRQTHTPCTLPPGASPTFRSACAKRGEPELKAPQS